MTKDKRWKPKKGMKYFVTEAKVAISSYMWGSPTTRILRYPKMAAGNSSSSPIIM